MFNFFKKKKKEAIPVQLPKERGMYAFTKHRRGEFVLYVNVDGEVLEFMHIPHRYNISLSKEEFTAAIHTRLLEFVEQIPEDVFEVCKVNINKLEKV